MKLQKNEIINLIKIVENSDFYYGIGLGSTPNVCDENNTFSWWKDEEKGKFSEETRKEIFSTLGNNFEDTCLFIFPMGTHCGSLKFVFGWIHEQNTTEEDIDDAVMPQDDNRGLEVRGFTINEVRFFIKETYGIEETKKALVNGNVVSEDYIIQRGDKLEFAE